MNANSVDVAFVEEFQLMKATRVGSDCILTLRAPLEVADLVRSHIGEQVEILARWIGHDGKRYGNDLVLIKANHGMSREYIVAMYKAELFTDNTLFLKAIGDDKDYQAWCRTQACAITGEFEEEHLGEWRNIYAHVSDSSRPTSGGKGQGSNKPIYSGIPMLQRLHVLQHSNGWEAVYDYYCEFHNQRKPIHYTDKWPLTWAKILRNRYLTKWAVMQLGRNLMSDDLTCVDPKKIFRWAESHQLGHLMPKWRYKHGGVAVPV